MTKEKRKTESGKRRKNEEMQKKPVEDAFETTRSLFLQARDK
jgi:hypothetical protein